MKPLFTKMEAVEIALTASEAKKLYATWVMYNEAYHNGKALVSDVEFDRLTKKLKPFYPNIDKKVGATPMAKHASARKVRLDVPMASLDKAYSDDLNNRIKSHIGTASEVVISEKIDGASLQFRPNGKRTQLLTRGKGGVGQDVSHLLPHIKRAGDITGKETIRTELVIPRGATLGEEDVARNAISGVINARTPNLKVLAQAYPIALSIMEPAMAPAKAFQRLKQLGWRIPRYKVVKTRDLNAKVLETLYKEWRQTAKYEMDGLVIAANVAEEPRITNPKRSFAFKVNEEGKLTEVISVSWQASRYGQLKPVVNIKPVIVDGVKVSKATGHNAKYIVDNRIGPGAQVEIIRSGGVIPYIASVKKKSAKASLPKAGSYVWDKTEVNILLNDNNTKLRGKVNARHLQNFFSKIGVLGFGPAVANLVDDKTIQEVASMDSDDWLDAGAGNAVSLKMPDTIKTALRNSTVPKLMAASGVFGQGFGDSRADDLWSVTGKRPPKTTKELAAQLEELSGWSLVSAKDVAGKWRSWVSWFNSLPYKPDVKAKKKIIKGALTGRVFVYTGIRDRALSADIEAKGGTIARSFNKSVTDLIYMDGKESIKTAKAEADGINTIPYSEARKKLKLL